VKILIYTHVFPYPLAEGGKVAQFGVIEHLAKAHEIILLAENSNPNVVEHANALQKLIPEINIRILKLKKPIEDKGFIPGLLKIVGKIQWRLNKQLSLKRPKTSRVNGINNLYPVHSRDCEIIEQFITIVKQEKPDLIQIDFIDNADLVNAIPEKIPKVLIHHDLRYVSVRQAAELENSPTMFSEYLSLYVKTIELAFLDKFDGIVTFSKDDKVRLLPALQNAKVIAIPFPVLDEKIIEITESDYLVDKLIFIGPDHHHPNLDAVEWYATQMAEQIWLKFKLKLVVIGKWTDTNIKSFNGNQWIEFAGFVEDLKDFSQNSIMLVPLRIGSGIRTKLLDAFSYGVPVISTTLGSEGLGVTDKKEVLIADTPDQFLKSISFLINTPEQLAAIRVNANELVQNNFSQKNICERRIEFYRQLLSKKFVL